MLADPGLPTASDLASNPVAEEHGKLDSDAFPEVKWEDTNAVVSPTHKDFVLTRVAGAFVALPIGVPYVGLAGLLMILTSNTYHEGEVSALTRVADICGACGTLVVLLGTAVSLRRATGTSAGRGQLATLGAGEARISERAQRSLGRAHVWISVLGFIFVMTGLLCFFTATRIGTRSKLTGRLITAAYARAVVAYGLNFCNYTLALAWWHTLKSASALVADSVAETRQAAERCSPTSPEWEAEVVPRVLGLCDTTLPLLSRGYGIGVAASFLGWWVSAAGWFALFLEHDEFGPGFFCVVSVLAPLGISYDAASASSDCDLLSDTLNQKRKRGPKGDVEHEHALGIVEKILSNENTKQGLGFIVGYRVMDLKTLGNIMAGIAGVASTAVPILFSLRPSTVSTGDIGDRVCGLSSLSASLLATIQGAVTGMGNETCTYNDITLGEIMGA
jgi:hypothetical protein